MARADKGLFITTGRFTREAEREAVREGAMAIDLIDGEALCTLLKETGLGVTTETDERVTPDRSFFRRALSGTPDSRAALQVPISSHRRQPWLESLSAPCL